MREGRTSTLEKKEKHVTLPRSGTFNCRLEVGFRASPLHFPIEDNQNNALNSTPTCITEPQEWQVGEDGGELHTTGEALTRILNADEQNK